MSNYNSVTKPESRHKAVNFVYLAFWLRDDLPPAFCFSDRCSYFKMRHGQYSVTIEDKTYMFHPLENRPDDRLPNEVFHEIADKFHNLQMVRYLVDLSGIGEPEIIIYPRPVTRGYTDATREKD